MAEFSVPPGFLDNSTSAENVENSDETPLESIPLYNIANVVMRIVYPIIILFGTFGNIMTIIVMQRMTSGEAIFRYFFTGMAITDFIFLMTTTVPEWLDIQFQYQIHDASILTCKLLIWLCTGSPTISCWYLVCLTLHRAMSVVWPHRVSVMCTRPTVLGLLFGITLFFSALYAHYLYGVELVSSDNGVTQQCMMESDAYIMFVFDVFVYMEVAIYSLFPFAFLVVGNSILVWRLFVSVKETRHKLSQGNTEQIVAREKVASSVTLTVVVVSVTFIVLTLPVSIEYILSYFAREYNQASGYELAKAHMIYVVCRLLADSNGAVNFYLYCLTGRKFREEFFRLIRCWRNTH